MKINNDDEDDDLGKNNNFEKFNFLAHYHQQFGRFEEYWIILTN
jgi:predicted secreted acid phosphatase